MVAALGGDLRWSGPVAEHNGAGPFLAPPGSPPAGRAGARRSLPQLSGGSADGAAREGTGEDGEEGMGNKDKVGVFIAICSALGSVSALTPKVL